MKALKIVVLVSMIVLFYVACGGSETGNGNGNGNRPAASANANAQLTPSPVPTNANTGTGVVVIPPANSNASATAAPTPSVPPPPPPAPASTLSPQELQAAAQLFTANKCTGCHGADGKGKVKGAPDFTNAGWHSKHSDAQLIEGIKKGDPPKMPAYQDKLSEDQIKTLVAYVRSFAKK